ncbi:MAG: response regulator, partial [Lachnospiraceae bacterium]|nr:response regulator [Lachnospiraceae bacterium]
MNDNRIRTGRHIFSVISIIVAAGTSIYAESAGRALGLFSLEGAPILMAGALCGDIPGLVSVLLVFQIRAIKDASSSYVTALYLVAVLLTSWASKRGAFRSLFRAISYGALLSLILGAMNGLVFSFAMSGRLAEGMFFKMLNSYTYSLPETVGTMLAAYLVFRLLPPKAKVYIPNGIYYISNEDPLYGGMAEKAMHRRKDASRLSFRITRVIILEAILLSVAAAAFAIHLVSILQPGGLAIGDMDANQAHEAPPAHTVSGGMLQEGEPDRKEDSLPEPKPVRAFGQRLEDSVSRNAIFNDDMGFSPFEKERGLDGSVATAFAFRLTMILFTIGVITAALADAYMQASVAKPIRRMAEAMQGFAFSSKDGSIGGTEALSGIRVRSRDEIKDLHDALVKTVADTEDYLERLREEDKIRNELEVAKASSDAKSNFLSSMSHEIRTPINAVLGFDEMILMENKDPEIGKYAEDIQSAGKTLLTLVNDILDFQKIEAGKMDIVPAQYELASTINDVVSMTMSLANDKDLSFDVSVDPRTPHLLYGDEIRIKQCMTNILSNAVKYTEKGGVTLTVGFERLDEEPDGDFKGSILLNVSVRDTGIGIREEDMEKLFTAFDRLDQVRNRAVKGTGLGMAITKQLLESMGSKIEVESEYGKGSNFHFSLKQKAVSWEETGNLTEAFRKYITHDGPEYRNDSFRAPSAVILVTDDTENNLLVVTRLLKRTGIKIDTADSGAKTLELVRKKKYDIIYLDHMMPGMDGIETLHRLGDLEGNLNTETPVIVLTANAVSGSREMYIKEGFTDYMTKPVSYKALRASLVKYLPEDRIGYGSAEPEAGDAEETDTPDISEMLRSVQGIDLEEGLIYSGDEATLTEVIRNFSAGIEESADRIGKELEALNIKDYTVHVHALKSSARLIGARELSELALEMENAGHSYQKAIAEGSLDSAAEELALMEGKTAELMALYRSYKEKLSPVTGGDTGGSGQEGLPEISSGELDEILAGVREFAEAFDMDSVDSAMGMLEGSAIPGDRQELVDRL